LPQTLLLGDSLENLHLPLLPAAGNELKYANEPKKDDKESDVGLI
jgi:hypothetical protein